MGSKVRGEGVRSGNGTWGDAGAHHATHTHTHPLPLYRGAGPGDATPAECHLLLTCLVTLPGSSSDNTRWGLGAELNT